MVVGSDELERLADDMYKDRLIAGSIYCGNCGYNLRTLPYAYTCPECGNDYNARPLKMHGIFSPHEAGFPFGDIAATGVCALGTFMLGRGAINPLNTVSLAIALVFAVFTLLFARQAYVRLRRYIKAIRIIRHIAAEEKE